jgi:dephospho-CoA kinase
MKVIGFVGLPGSGKTDASHVAAELGIPVLTMGDIVREEVGARALPGKKTTDVADDLRRREGMDAIAKRSIARIEEMKKLEKKLIIDGIRGIAEVNSFKRAFGENFMLIGIESSKKNRYERMMMRGRADDEEFKKRDRVELSWGLIEAMENADMIVTNDGSLGEFKEKIRAILDELG